MGDVVRRMSWSECRPKQSFFLRREWLVTNGLGGYASGTTGVPDAPLSWSVDRRTARSAGPHGHAQAFARTAPLSDGTVVQIGGEERGENDLEMPAVNH